MAGNRATKGQLLAGGIDSADGRWRVATVTNAQVLALNATPIEIIPAPGAGKAILVDLALIRKPAGTAYGGIAAGEDLVLKYTDAAGAELTEQIETTGFLDQATEQLRLARPKFLAQAALAPVANAKVVLHLLVGEVITGTSALKVRVRYKIVPVVF